MVVQTHRGLVDQSDPMMTNPAVQHPRNTRVPQGTNPEQPNIQPHTVGHGVISPLVGITPGVQETRNISSSADQTTPSIGISSTTNAQRTVGDDTKIQNLRDALGLMQSHNNAFHHEQEDLRTAINLPFDEQRRQFIEWRDREMETSH
uniref:Uncharacterized protein n=1 Tax=Cannabis sativa TaxID=3483 RepID=A0A803Q5S7_CANSA